MIVGKYSAAELFDDFVVCLSFKELFLEVRRDPIESTSMCDRDFFLIDNVESPASSAGNEDGSLIVPPYVLCARERWKIAVCALLSAFTEASV